MAQFDLYVNSSKATKKAYPYILELQNDLLSEIATRIVVPLADYNSMKTEEFTKLTPKITYAGKELLILIPQITSISVNNLGQPIDRLAHFRDEILAALDFAITGF